MFWKQHPVRLRTLFRDIYIIQGAHDQYTFMKTPSLSAFFVSRTFLVNVFCLPHSAAKTYLKDDSGEHAKPRAGSQVPNRNRIQFYTRTSQQRGFIGAGSASTFRRLHCSVRRRVGSIEVAEHWTHIPDFTKFFKFHVTAAAVDAMVGPYLMQHYPSLADDLWSIEENFGSFITKLPRFVNPEAHRLRERALNSVRQWHVWARENFTPASVDEDGNDPYWGTAFFRDRQKTLSNMDGFTHEALASTDLSFLWG